MVSDLHKINLITPGVRAWIRRMGCVPCVVDGRLAVSAKVYYIDWLQVIALMDKDDYDGIHDYIEELCETARKGGDE